MFRELAEPSEMRLKPLTLQMGKSRPRMSSARAWTRTQVLPGAKSAHSKKFQPSSKTGLYCDSLSS